MTAVRLSRARAAILAALTLAATVANGYDLFAGDGGAWELGFLLVFAAMTAFLARHALRGGDGTVGRDGST